MLKVDPWVSQQKYSPSHDWGPGGFWFAFCWIAKKSFTLSLFAMAKLLARTCAISNWTILMMQSSRRKGNLFLKSNSTPHTPIVIRQKFRQLGWEGPMHPPCSLVLAPKVFCSRIFHFFNANHISYNFIRVFVFDSCGWRFSNLKLWIEHPAPFNSTALFRFLISSIITQSKYCLHNYTYVTGLYDMIF